MAAQDKILKIPLRVSMTLLLLGMLAQILDWPHANEMLLLCFITVGVLYAIRFWKKSKKKFIDHVKVTLVVFWSINGISSILGFQYTLFFQVVIGITFLIWFVLDGTAYFLDEDRKSKNSLPQILWNIAMVVGTLSIIMGSLLNMLNWQFSLPLLVFGILTVAVYILKDVFIVPKMEKDDHNNEEFQL